MRISGSLALFQVDNPRICSIAKHFTTPVIPAISALTSALALTLRSVEAYSPLSQSWYLLPPLSSPRQQLVGVRAASHGRYFAGALQRNRTPTSRAISATCSQSLSHPRVGSSFAIFCGGMTSSNFPSADVDVYDVTLRSKVQESPCIFYNTKPLFIIDRDIRFSLRLCVLRDSI